MHRFALAAVVGTAFAAAGCRDGASGADRGAVVGRGPDGGGRVNADIPVCRNRADIEGLDGRRVILVGTYGQIDVRQRRRPPPSYSGHVAITLEDSTLVLLEPVWKAEAVRPREEIREFEGEKVGALGVIHKVAPESPAPAANLLAPCLTAVESVERTGRAPPPEDAQLRALLRELSGCDEMRIRTRRSEREVRVMDAGTVRRLVSLLHVEVVKPHGVEQPAYEITFRRGPIEVGGVWVGDPFGTWGRRGRMFEVGRCGGGTLDLLARLVEGKAERGRTPVNRTTTDPTDRAGGPP